MRYLGSVDVTGQLVTTPTAGLPEVEDSYESNGEDPPEYDFVTEIRPALRIYYNWPRNLVFVRYMLGLQFYAQTPNGPVDNNGNSDGPLVTYTNTLHQGFSHLFSHVTEIAVANHFTQGTAATTVAPYLSGGRVNNGFQTVGSGFVADSLVLAVGHQIGNQWSLRGRLTGDLFSPYDRWYDRQAGVIPPPLTFGLSTGGEATRQFSLGRLRLGLNGAYQMVYRDRGLYADPFAGMEEQQNGFLLAATAGWIQPLSPVWTAWIGGGIDLRIRQNELETGTPGYNDPEPGPVADIGIRFLWRQRFGGSLGYGFGTRQILENAVATLAQTHTVGLDLFFAHRLLRLDVMGSFRYVHNRNETDDDDAQDATITGRARAALSYQLFPGMSVELGYSLETVSNRLVQARDVNTQIIGIRPVDDYTQHRVIFGLSLAWPPPPPQAQRLTRRESEYEPLLLRMGQPGAGEETDQGFGLTDPGRGDRREDPTRDPFEDIAPPPEQADPTPANPDPLPSDTDPLPRGADPLPDGADPRPESL